MGYIKTKPIRGHYGPADPDCSICHGTGEIETPGGGLPCECRFEGMTFEEMPEELIEVIAEPLEDGGTRIHMRKVDPSKSQ